MAEEEQVRAGQTRTNQDCPYGLDEHLKSFRDTKGYEGLYSSWDCDRIRYRERLACTGMSNPHYSDHGETHSKNIISAMELLLGEKRIRQLSASDTWLLMQCAYTHDFGMAMSHKDMVAELAAAGDDYLDEMEAKFRKKEDKDALEALIYIRPIVEWSRGQKQKGFSFEASGRGTHSMQMDDQQKYDIYRSSPLLWPTEFIDRFVTVMEAFFRDKHAENSQRILVGKAYKNNRKECVIPLRLRLLTAGIAQLHAESQEKIMKDLPQQCLGICNDYVHPRFAAVMLRLGDLLDMDNGRFNRTQLEIVGGGNEGSLVHLLKHEAITHFLVTPQEISVYANFDTSYAETLLAECRRQQGELKQNKESGQEKPEPCGAVHIIDAHQLCMKACKALGGWLEWLKNEVEFFSYNWLEIVPRKLEGACPYFHPPELTINRKKVTEHELKLKYEISTKRSAEIIEGAGLYTAPQTVFLREVLQNALDASKIQLYRDVLSGMHPGFYNADGEGVSSDDIKELTPYCFFSKLRQAAQQYRVEYCIEAIDDAGKVLRAKDDKTGRKPAAIRFTIRDYGIGITESDLKAMLHIGDIKKPEQDAENKKMPEWLRTTGHFGIGLQTVFYLVKSFTIRSRPRNEEGHFAPPLREMRFYSNRLGGEIDVQLLGDDRAVQFGFGTEVLVEIPLRNPQARISFFSSNMDTESEHAGYDVFDETLESMKEKLRGHMEDCFDNPTLLPVKERRSKPEVFCPPEGAAAKRYGTEEHLGQFKDFCVLLDHDEIKYSQYSPRVLETARSWSCWSASRKMLLVYRRQEETSFRHISGKLRVFFKGIKVADTDNLADAVHIPFWDIDIHLFRVHAGELLAISREKILEEKVKPLAKDIYETHMELLRFLFHKEEQLGREIEQVKIEAELAELEQQQQWLNTVWCRDIPDLSADDRRLKEYYAFAKTYYAYYVALDEKNTAARDYLKHPLRAKSYLHDECFPCFDIMEDWLKYTDEKGKGLRNPLELSIARSIAGEPEPIWFVNAGALPGLDSKLIYIPVQYRPKNLPDKEETPKVLRIYPNNLYRYPMFAAREFQTLRPMHPDTAAAVAIYRLDQRKYGRDGLVKAQEEDYLDLARSLIRTATARPVFPSRQGFEKICVTRLIDGLDAPEFAAFDSYIRSQLPGEELEKLTEALDGKSETERHQQIMEAIPEQWIENNLMLVDFIHQFNVRSRKTGAAIKAATKAEKCDIWRAYCKFLKLLMKP